MTTGMGHFGPASISDLAKDLRITLSSQDSTNALNKSTYSIQDVVERAEEFFHSKYAEITPPPTDHSFEFWVGGYGAAHARGEIWKFSIQNQERIEPHKIASAEDDDRVIWGGQPQAISRLIVGFDHNLISILDELGFEEDTAQLVIDSLRPTNDNELRSDLVYELS